MTEMELLALAALFITPFFQEDLAVVGAAALAASPSLHSNPPLVLFVAFAGLVVSDVWKYWAGRLAKRSSRLRALADRPGLEALREKVLKRLGMTLFAVRFLPGTRIPTYVAAGFFHAPWLPFFAYVASSAALYIGIMYSVVRLAGVAAGERAGQYIAIALACFIALSLLVSWLRHRSRRSADSGSEAGLSVDPPLPPG